MPKYLRLEMQPASGTVVAAGGGGVVEQVVRITNSMQAREAYPDSAVCVWGGGGLREGGGVA